jgi:ubiquinone/menaquinone biosynthesis C-methylase UbiE
MGAGADWRQACSSTSRDCRIVAPILDLGCGTGSLSLAMTAVRSNCRIMGIDRSLEFVSFARNRAPASGVQFQAADAQSLPFLSGAFDSVASFLCSISFLIQRRLSPKPAG